MQTNNSIPKCSILTQNKFLEVVKMKWHWMFFAVILPIFILLIILSATPDSEAGNVKLRTITSEVILPFNKAKDHSDEVFWQVDQVRRNDTLGKLFDRMGVHDNDAKKFLTLSSDSKAINTQLIPGRTLEIKTDADGKLLYLEYELRDDNILVAGLTPSGYQIAQQKLILEQQQVIKSATIINSLFGATDDAGIPDQIALQIASIFSGVIDFNQDLRSGDKFNVLYEAFYNAGELMKTGKVLAVEFLSNGKLRKAIHFGDADTKYAYYTPEGENLHKSFLRSPLEFSRVSSSFSRGRYHPILNRIRAHKGVDFAAAHGTRIKASGDGVIKFMGRKGGYGNVVIIKHNNKISTVYGHLARFSKILRRGSEVTQGDIIGYVGKTGLATGPHLHYEFLLNGVHRNPMTVELPSGRPIDPNYKDAFKAKNLELFAKIEMLNRQLSAASSQ